ncbi:MAG: segregation/condensation protein A [Treponema sp.]|jgi:segregation and condensation protein A|nr:segregation/condensation protein A [Treponema sp.]
MESPALAAAETPVHKPDTGSSPDDSPGRRFKVREFEGPLDLLLFLIKKNDVRISDIPVAEITKQYLEYLKYVAILDLEDLTEFHGQAVELLYIKSRMLLPVEIDLDEIEDPRQGLVEKLIEYQRIKKLTGLMEERSREAEWVIERKKMQRPLPFKEEEIWEELDVWDLVKTFSALMDGIGGDERIIDLYEEVSINEKITLLSELMETRGECGFTDLVARRGSIMDIICAFLALLEAVKERMVTIYQNRMFGDILIRAREDRAGARNAADTQDAKETYKETYMEAKEV